MNEKEEKRLDKAIELLQQVPDDMDYATDRDFRIALNKWYWDEVAPFLEEEK